MLSAGGNIDPILTRSLANLRTAPPEGGCVTVLQPDGKEAPCSPISGHGLVGPWSAAVDGDDNVRIASFRPATAGIVQLCGANPKAWPPGKKMGDAISPPGGYVGGSMQMLIDIAVDPAGNVWVDNNWQDIDAGARPGSRTLVHPRCWPGRGRLLRIGQAGPHAAHRSRAAAKIEPFANESRHCAAPHTGAPAAATSPCRAFMNKPCPFLNSYPIPFS